MQVFGWVLMGLFGWTAIGVLGTVLALATEDRSRARRGMGWIVGVWVVYLAVLLSVGRLQQRKVLAIGQEECFGKTCYSVTGVNAVGEFKGAGGGSLLQVSLRVRNGGKETVGLDGLRAFLVDGAGRQWSQTRGLGGVSLGVVLPPGGAATSEPVFRVARGEHDLYMMLTRGYGGWNWLTIGNTDSLGAKKTLLRLQ